MSGVAREHAWWVLGIDPTARGFAFAVLAGPDQLLDWGSRSASSEAAFATAVRELCDQYAPHIIALEREFGGRRGTGASVGIGTALSVAAEREIATVKFSRKQINSTLGTATKHQMALAIAQRFTELKGERLPRPRTLGSSEDERMNIFDAISFALTVLLKL